MERQKTLNWQSNLRGKKTKNEEISLHKKNEILLFPATIHGPRECYA